jgi:hypothetical protein
LSFFDDDDEPRTTAAPRRPVGATRPPGVAGPADRQQLMVRRGVALGIALVVLILIVLGIKGCLDSQKHNALRSYNRNVSTLINESQSQVSAPLFSALNNARSKSPQDLQTTISELHITAQEEANRARSLSVPDEMSAPQRVFLLTMDFRASAIDRIASNILTAFVPGGGSQATDALNRIAGQMEVLLASDVVYSQRVAPLIRQILADNGISGAPPSTSQFVPDVGWLDPNTVRSRLGVAGGTSPSGPVAPGAHGHHINSTSVNGTTLQTATTNHVTGAANPTFSVMITNGGANNESNVKVDITATGGGKNLTATKTLNQTVPGQSYTANIALGSPVPTGVPLKVVAFVEPVPGETNTVHNKQTYTVIFTR